MHHTCVSLSLHRAPSPTSNGGGALHHHEAKAAAFSYSKDVYMPPLLKAAARTSDVPHGDVSSTSARKSGTRQNPYLWRGCGRDASPGVHLGQIVALGATGQAPGRYLRGPGHQLGHRCFGPGPHAHRTISPRSARAHTHKHNTRAQSPDSEKAARGNAVTLIRRFAQLAAVLDQAAGQLTITDLKT